MDEKLPICKAQDILKPECTAVHEARFIIWQDSEATRQMGDFSSIHQLKIYAAWCPWERNNITYIANASNHHEKSFKAHTKA